MQLSSNILPSTSKAIVCKSYHGVMLLPYVFRFCIDLCRSLIRKSRHEKVPFQLRNAQRRPRAGGIGALFGRGLLHMSMRGEILKMQKQRWQDTIWLEIIGFLKTIIPSVEGSQLPPNRRSKKEGCDGVELCLKTFKKEFYVVVADLVILR